MLKEYVDANGDDGYDDSYDNEGITLVVIIVLIGGIVLTATKTSNIIKSLFMIITALLLTKLREMR